MDSVHKPDSIIQTSVDRRDLAVIAQYLFEKQKRISNKSELLRICVEMVAEMIVDSGQILAVNSTEEATKILAKLGIRGLNVKGRLNRNLTDNLQLDQALNGDIAIIEKETPRYTNAKLQNYPSTRKQNKFDKDIDIQRGLEQGSKGIRELMRNANSNNE
jgi:hypothetical protein